jgi:hypothetical protein
MTHEELERMKTKIYSGLDMLLDKSEKIGKGKSEWSLDELYKMADIEKDMAKAFKCIVKSEVMMNEHSIEKY